MSLPIGVLDPAGSGEDDPCGLEPGAAGLVADPAADPALLGEGGTGNGEDETAEE
jgi:hypothetical protein